MSDPFADVRAARIVAFHAARIAQQDGAPGATPAWSWIEQNHRFNGLLWDEEDLARRRDVPDRAIAANKRAIDGYNQQRNDATERIDEALLARVVGVAPHAGAWHNSETAGAMIDRLSILSLKVFHMGVQARRADAAPGHVEACGEKLARLVLQREDLARCLDTLFDGAAAGTAFWKVYRQFKMYNDPSLNPALYRRGST